MSTLQPLAVALLVTASGCRFLLGDPPDDNNPNGSPDAASAMADANTDPLCGWGTALPQGGICLADLPAASPPIPASLDTGTSGLCTQYSKGGGLYCVIAGTDLSISSVRVTGSIPLVVIATGTLTVTGTLDAASHTDLDMLPGPGNDPELACNYGTGPQGGNNTETRGGGGGSFGGPGGYGGLRQGQSPDVVTPSGKPGDPIVLAAPTVLRGGCRGQDGNTAPISIGGLGGGAVYLVGGTSINIEATAAINASGAGGHGGAALRGGAGGGSGGMIVLEAPMVNVLGRVFANGGGGGEGGGTGTAGDNGNESNGLTAAVGGKDGAGQGGYGGDGSYGTSINGEAGGSNNSDVTGGGGGGGAGIIWIRSQGGTRTGVISPQAADI